MIYARKSISDGGNSEKTRKKFFFGLIYIYTWYFREELFGKGEYEKAVLNFHPAFFPQRNFGSKWRMRLKSWADVNLPSPYIVKSAENLWIKRSGLAIIVSVYFLHFIRRRGQGCYVLLDWQLKMLIIFEQR